MVESISELLKG